MSNENDSNNQNKDEQRPQQRDPFQLKNFFRGESSGGKNPQGPQGPRRDPARNLIMWLVIIVMVLMGLRFVQQFGTYQPTRISYSQFQTLLAEFPSEIKEIRVTQKGFNRATAVGELFSQDVLAQLPGLSGTPPNRYFTTNLPFIDSEMLQQWDQAGFTYTFEVEKMNWGDVLFGLLPWVLMIAFWLFMIRQMQSGQKGIFSFGKSRAKLQSVDRPRNKFTDVAGADEAKGELEEIIEFLEDPQKFRILGGKIPKGVLLLGPPGTGKTLLARAVAGEAGVPFLSMSGSDFVEMFVGVGASRVRDLFDTAKKNSPCIIFIDEIDAVGRQRGAGLGGGHDEREQTLNQMLVEMDGFEVNSGVILIAATNRPDVLDPALLRPGRFDRQIVVDAPDMKGRVGILQVHTRDVPLDSDVELETIARGTPGFVGADLANLVNEAALLAARFGQTKVKMIDFEEAKDKVFMGVERRSMVLSPKERETTAYHEAGHAICNIYCEKADPLHKVTIIPRGRALGVTWSLPKEDSYSHSKEYILDKVCMAMGGRAAEDIIYQHMTTGASNDIKQATSLIRRMICDFGMSEELGPLAYGDNDESIFLGRDFNQHRVYSEKTAEAIDAIMRKTIQEQYDRAKKILLDHNEELERLAKALIQHETLDIEEVRKVIEGETLESVKKNRPLPPRKTRSKVAHEEKEKEREQQRQSSDSADSSSSDTQGSQPDAADSDEK